MVPVTPSQNTKNAPVTRRLSSACPQPGTRSERAMAAMGGVGGGKRNGGTLIVSRPVESWRGGALGRTWADAALVKSRAREKKRQSRLPAAASSLEGKVTQ